MNEKIVAIQVGKDTDLSKFNLEKIVGFTNNINYLGSTKETKIPVYYNKKLGNGEIKEIMETKDYKELADGKYQAKVEQVIRKNADGKKTVSIEMEVVGETDLQYLTFCVEGYSEMQCKIANEQIDKICIDFGITTLEELAGKQVVLTAKTNAKGYKNLYVAPKRVFFDWENFAGFKYTDEVKFDCEVKKFYKAKMGEKYVFYIVANIDGKSVDEFVVYDFAKPYKQDSFNWILGKLGLTMDDVDKDLAKVPAKLAVKKNVVGEKVFINKKITTK